MGSLFSSEYNILKLDDPLFLSALESTEKYKGKNISEDDCDWSWVTCPDNISPTLDDPRRPQRLKHAINSYSLVANSDQSEQKFSVAISPVSIYSLLMDYSDDEKEKTLVRSLAHIGNYKLFEIFLEKRFITPMTVMALGHEVCVIANAHADYIKKLHKNGYIILDHALEYSGNCYAYALKSGHYPTFGVLWQLLNSAPAEKSDQISSLKRDILVSACKSSQFNSLQLLKKSYHYTAKDVREILPHISEYLTAHNNRAANISELHSLFGNISIGGGGGEDGLVKADFLNKLFVQAWDRDVPAVAATIQSDFGITNEDVKSLDKSGKYLKYVLEQQRSVKNINSRLKSVVEKLNDHATFDTKIDAQTGIAMLENVMASLILNTFPAPDTETYSSHVEENSTLDKESADTASEDEVSVLSASKLYESAFNNYRGNFQTVLLNYLSFMTTQLFTNELHEELFSTMEAACKGVQKEAALKSVFALKEDTLELKRLNDKIFGATVANITKDIYAFFIKDYLPNKFSSISKWTSF